MADEGQDGEIISVSRRQPRMLWTLICYYIISLLLFSFLLYPARSPLSFARNDLFPLFPFHPLYRTYRSYYAVLVACLSPSWGYISSKCLQTRHSMTSVISGLMYTCPQMIAHSLIRSSVCFTKSKKKNEWMNLREKKVTNGKLKRKLLSRTLKWTRIIIHTWRSAMKF